LQVDTATVLNIKMLKTDLYSAIKSEDSEALGRFTGASSM